MPVLLSFADGKAFYQHLHVGGLDTIQASRKNLLVAVPNCDRMRWTKVYCVTTSPEKNYE
jgi:hypothetical protein